MNQDERRSPRKPPATPVLALVADLIFAARIRGTAEAVGTPVVTLSSPDELFERAAAAPPPLILVDLDSRAGRPAALVTRLKEDPRTSGVRLVAFVSHVREEAIAEARAAGADRVMAKGAFVRELSAILAGV